MFDIPIQFKKAVNEIYGEHHVEGVTIATIRTKGEVVPGSEEHISADFVCISGGLYPLAELHLLLVVLFILLKNEVVMFPCIMNKWKHH